MRTLLLFLCLVASPSWALIVALPHNGAAHGLGWDPNPPLGARVTTQNTLRVWAFIANQTIAASNFAQSIRTGAASTLCGLCLYDAGGTLRARVDGQNCATSGTVQNTAVSVTMTAGEKWWLGAVCSGANCGSLRWERGQVISDFVILEGYVGDTNAAGISGGLCPASMGTVTPPATGNSDTWEAPMGALGP